MRRLRSPVSVLLALAAAAACSAPPPTDTGYVGTWGRGGERNRSIVSIVERDGEYLFRWSGGSADGSWKVACDWDGSCVETQKGERTATYRFSTSVDPESGRLRVEVRGRDLVRDREVHYVDELRVRRQGLRLVARMVESDGEPVPEKRPPTRRFEKVSDRVEDPPPGGD